MKIYVQLLALICSTYCLQSQTVLNAPALTPDTISIELSNDNVILLDGLLNDQDSIKLMFHMAANDMTIINTVAQACESISWEESHDVHSWGGKSQSRYSKSNKLSIGNLSWSEIPIWENKQSGKGSEGKIGPNLFSDRYLEMDFERGIMVLHHQEPDIHSAMTQIELDYENGFMFIPATVVVDSIQVEHKFLIHTGYSKSLLLDDAFVASNSLSNHLEVTSESELKDSFGNILKTKSALLPQFQIGAFSFDDVEVSFFEGAINRQKMSVLGTDILKQFHLIISADRKSIYLEARS